MKSLTYHNQVLVALAQEHEEARRPVAMMIVMAAVNASTAAQQEKVLLVLASLKRQGYVTQKLDRWEVTADGHRIARQMMAGKAKAAAPAATEPMESGFKARRGRDTLRQSVGGAPRPVTRPGPVPTIKESLSVAPGPGPSSTACDDQWREERIDVIGQNGPTGEHYELPAEAPNHFADVSNMVPGLLDRCAAMHLTLLAQAKAARDAGDPGAGRELAWLLETGRQLLAAGGLAQ